MEVNFDLLISGCNTHCRHCYVNGGPGKNMDLELALLSLRRLDEIAALLPFPASFTLDNEPVNHPNLGDILRAASSTKHIRYHHHGMTTGIALMRRRDKAEVVQSYLDCGCGEFGITLHGSAAHHDEIVRREGAFQTSIEAAEFLKAKGVEINVSLMLNRFFPEDAAELDRILARLNPAFIWFAVPNYTPHANMSDFEPYRSTLQDLEALALWLPKWGQDRDGLLQNAEQSTVAAAIRQLEKGLSLKALFAEKQDELYCTLHQDGLLYLGNTGVETICLGDIRTLHAAQVSEILARAPGNRDYGAFYDPRRLPGEDELLRTLKTLPRELLYADLPSVLYRGLAELRTPTIIMRKKDAI